MIVIHGKEPLQVGDVVTIETDSQRNWVEVPAKVMRKATRAEYLQHCKDIGADYRANLPCGPYFYWASVD